MKTLSAVIIAIAAVLAAEQPADRSGVYKSRIGELSLLEGDNGVLFSYEAVFGQAPNVCDWGGTAGRDTADRFATKNDGGTATLSFSQRELVFEMKDGSSYFCGAGWPGDRFPLASRAAPSTCTVRAARATFFDVVTRDPLKAFVVSGDRVDVVPSQQVEGEPYLLARFTGPKVRTLGLLKKTDLTCPR